jgi:hypothetical protein
MKYLLCVLLFTFIITAFPSAAQTNDSVQSKPTTGQRYKDGVAMINGKMMELKNSQQTPMTGTKTIAGTKVSPTGQVTLADGTQKQLREGKAVNMQGRIVNFRDDMFLPSVIMNESQRKDPTHQTEIIQRGDSIHVPKK